MTDLHFSEKYRNHVNMANPLWRLIRAVTFTLSFGRDCVFPYLRAQQADHIPPYKHLGRELPWIDVVPLHATTHALVTELRKKPGLATPVNFVLRATYGTWILLWFYTAALLGQLIGLFHNVPWPWQIAGVVHAIAMRLTSFDGTLRPF